jgi:hypothetical protein
LEHTVEQRYARNGLTRVVGHTGPVGRDANACGRYALQAEGDLPARPNAGHEHWQHERNARQIEDGEAHILPIAWRAGVRFKMAGGAALTGASIEAPHATGSDTFLWSRLVSEQFSEPISKSGDNVTMTARR